MQLTCCDVLFSVISLILIREYSAQSSCTQFFEYKTDETGNYGIIHLFPREQVSSISTKINFTIAESLPSHYAGRLEPLGQPSSLIQQFNQGYPIEYRMHFPVDSPVLRITSIVVNNDLICTGPPVPDENITSLSLAHFLNDRSIRPPKPAFSSSSQQQQVSSPFGFNNVCDVLRAYLSLQREFSKKFSKKCSLTLDLSPYIVITNSQVDLQGQGSPQPQLPYFPPGPSAGLWRPQTYAQPPGMMPPGGFCENGQYSGHPTDCTRYRYCRNNIFEEYSCTAEQHWNQEKKLCDWISIAQCEANKAPVTTTTEEPIEETTEEEAVTFPPVTPELMPALLRTPYKLVCYYTNWSWYRPGTGKFVPEDIDPSLCTHIVYGFATLSDGVITAYDPWADIRNRFYERAIELKKFGVKLSIGIGGWEDSKGDKYSKLVNSPEARIKFVNHAVEFIQKHQFDGLDLHWEYPKCWQSDCSLGPDSDREGFADLVRELSAVFKPKGLLLSSAVSSNKNIIDNSYDVPTLAQHLDWIAVMTYDYHGNWDKKTGHVAPLYRHPTDDNNYFNANFTIRYWMEKGAPASKLIMGIPMHGQTFTLGSQWGIISNNGTKITYSLGLNVAATAGGDAGKSTEEKGSLAYYEICDRIRKRKWTVVKDPSQRMGPFAFKGNQWVSFDDTEIIKKKVDFITSLNLAGGMVWTLDFDDFKNRCKQGKYPLINTIKNAFLESSMDVVIIETETIKQQQTAADNDVEENDERLGYDQPSTEPITEPTTTLTTLTFTPSTLLTTSTLTTSPASTPTPRQTSAPITTTTTRLRPTTFPTTTPTIMPTALPTTKSTTLTTTTNGQIVNKTMANERFKVLCYYTNWSWYRPGSGKYTPDDIDPSLCTHIIYAFAVLDSNKLVMKSNDNWLDVTNKFYERVVALKNLGVKVLLGLGGWNDSAGNKYSRLVNNKSARRKFIVHALEYIEKYKFDGLDLDWEYPTCWQFECEKGPSKDKKGFADLVKELHEAFSSKGLLLSAIVSSNKIVIDLAYDIAVLAKNLDWITLMSYSYHGPWDQKTGHSAPLYFYELDDDNRLNVNFTVNYWITKGAPRQKLVVGMPFFGQSYSLTANDRNGVGHPTHAAGEAGDETKRPGFLAFYEICHRIKSQGWEVNRSADGTYATLDDQWVSFDDDSMTRRKAEYVAAMDLGGSMVWTLDLDDFTGEHCGCGKFPLLANINHVLRGKAAPPSCSLEVTV